MGFRKVGQADPVDPATRRMLTTMKQLQGDDGKAAPIPEEKHKKRVVPRKFAGESTGETLKNALDIIARQPAPPMTRRDEGVLMVRRSRYAEGVLVSESEDEHRVPTPRFETEVARTRVQFGRTVSLGGFEFARIDVMVEMPCNPNPQDLDETNAFASQKATEYMQREMATIPVAPVPQITHQRTDTSILDNALQQ
jgi:hypothetical protein